MKSSFHKDVAWVAGIVYFIQGAIGIAAIALPLFLKKQGFSISQITMMSSVSATPWFFKIIYGAISDGIVINKLRRKPYLIICSILSFSGWFFLWAFPPLVSLLILAMFVANLGLAAMDVITDGLVVEHSDETTTQIYQSISWGARSFGALLSGIVGGYLASQIPYKFIFLITGSLSAVSLTAVLFLREIPSDRKSDLIAPIIKSLRFLFQGNLKWFSILLLISGFPSALGTPFFFFMHERLGFDEIYIGMLTSVAWLGAVFGCLLFVKIFKEAPLKNVLYWAVGLNFLQVLALLAIRGHISAFVVSLFGGILGYVTLLPFMSAAAKLASGTGVEGSLFAILMSLFNFSQVSSTFCGGFLYEQLGLIPLVIITAFAGLLGLLVIPRIKTL